MKAREIISKIIIHFVLIPIYAQLYRVNLLKPLCLAPTENLTLESKFKVHTATLKKLFT